MCHAARVGSVALLGDWLSYRFAATFSCPVLSMKSVCVFCGSQTGHNSVYEQTAQELGQLLASRGIRLIYGGGNIGLMGIVADAVLDAGGQVIGVIPHALAEKEVAHLGLTELMLVESMHDRKAKMADLAEGFIAMPGGFGTFEEFCEVLTWNQLGIHTKPCGVLNVAGFYNPFIELLDRALAEGFLRSQHRQLVCVSDRPEDLLNQMGHSPSASGDKWLSPRES